MQREIERVPLCIDLDGTLLRTDLLHESVFLLLKQNPLQLLWLPLWLLRGRAYLKARLAERVRFDWGSLPVNDEVAALAREARAEGRPVVLATASPRRLAEPLAESLGLFDAVVSTEGGVNLSGKDKCAALVARYGERGFDYAGNGRSDLPVWASARRSIVVSPSAALARAAAGVSEVERVLPVERPRPGTYLRALRVHQWLKNLLIFVPLAAAHQLSSLPGLLHALLAFVAFSACASSVYVLNDLLDLEADRGHVRKRKRPFASALIPVWQGALMAPALLLVAFAVAAFVTPAFCLVLAVYFAITLASSLLLKRQVIVDVLLLAGLYTLRVVAGGAATGIVPSFWLLAFSMFIFLSLALVKRYSEMLVTAQQNRQTAAGRGYSTQDLPVLMSAGTSSAMVAVLVLALYINNPSTESLYPASQWLWLAPPLMLYWVSRLWMKAHRGEIDDDPVVFAMRDWQSLTVVGLMAGCFALASFGVGA